MTDAQDKANALITNLWATTLATIGLVGVATTHYRMHTTSPVQGSGYIPIGAFIIFVISLIMWYQRST